MRKTSIFFILTLLASFLIFMPGAQANQIKRISSLCAQNTNMPDIACDCVAKKAEDLNNQEQEMIATMLSGDQARAAALRGEMPYESLVKAGMFMSNASKECANELHGAKTK